MSEAIKGHPKTTWAGILVAIGTVATAAGKAFADGFQVADISMIVTTAIAAIGLLLAADGSPKAAKHWPDQR